jgi:hypothetical protein
LKASASAFSHCRYYRRTAWRWPWESPTCFLPWNIRLRAPLTEPGVNAAAGEYILTVNGVELAGGTDLHLLFQTKAGRITTLRLGANPDGTGAREVRVTPIDDESGLRHRAWVEERRTALRGASPLLPLSGGGVGLDATPGHFLRSLRDRRSLPVAPNRRLDCGEGDCPGTRKGAGVRRHTHTFRMQALPLGPGQGFWSNPASSAHLVPENHNHVRHGMTANDAKPQGSPHC